MDLAYRSRAVAAAKQAEDALAQLGARVMVTGSLARDDFGVHSDIDLLVTSCPRSLKYTLEAKVEDILMDIPFDLVYLDELPSWKAKRFQNDAILASELR